jgi:hypothetical protein
VIHSAWRLTPVVRIAGSTGLSALLTLVPAHSMLRPSAVDRIAGLFFLQSLAGLLPNLSIALLYTVVYRHSSCQAH